jgi:uncharacterized membrane protein|tara:strand:- start:2032 stop:2433 length:402 start_codon:yes stop_codon:yes gene_type:complete
MTGGLTIFCRFFLSFFFILSGIVKLLDPGRFYLDVKAFELLPLNVAYGVALFLPVFELVAAAALWIPRLRRGAAALLGLSILSFMGALLMSHFRGLNLDCGCFGDWLIFPSLSAHIAFNTGLGLMGLWLLRSK